MSGVNQWKLKDNSSAFQTKNTNFGAVYKPKSGEATVSNALPKSNNEVGSKTISKHEEKLSNETSDKKVVVGGNNVRRDILKDSKRPAGGLSEEEKLEGKDGKCNPFVAESVAEVELESPLNHGRTKGLAGFWANQNDEVKVVKKKKLTSVEENITPSVVENTPQKLDGVVRSEDPGEWKKPLQLEEGRTKNIAANISQKPEIFSKRFSLGSVGSKEENDVPKVKVSGMSQQFVRQSSESWKDKVKPDAVDPLPTAIVLAENQPAELNPDVVRNSDNSEVVVLESGRTKNLLQHWKNTEVDFLTPKVSTTRYQGTKPAWILEIEAAKGIVNDEVKEDEGRKSNLEKEEELHTPERGEDPVVGVFYEEPTVSETNKTTFNKPEGRIRGLSDTVIEKTTMSATNDIINTISKPEVSNLPFQVSEKIPDSNFDENTFVIEKHSETETLPANYVPELDLVNDQRAERETTWTVDNMDKYFITSKTEASDGEIPHNEQSASILSPDITIETPKQTDKNSENAELFLPGFQASPELQNFVRTNLNLDDLLNIDHGKEWQMSDQDETPCLTPCGISLMPSPSEEVYKTPLQTPVIRVELAETGDFSTTEQAEMLTGSEGFRDVNAGFRKFAEHSQRPRSEEIDSFSRNVGVVETDRPVSCYVETKAKKKKVPTATLR